MKDDILLISSYLEYILSITFDESNVAVLFNRQVLKFNYFLEVGQGAEGRGKGGQILPLVSFLHAPVLIILHDQRHSILTI